ncbi:V4R domain-containing protein [Methanocaldococcus sp. 10A]
MTNAIKIIEMLRIIDNRAKFMGIKLNMMKNLLEKYKDNKELLKEVLKLTEGTRLHELILEAYPPLEELKKELKEEYQINLTTGEELESKEDVHEFCVFEGNVSIIAYIREYLRRFYFGSNVKRIFYDIGKDYAIRLGIDNYKDMIEFMNEEFGEVHIEESEPLTIIVKDNKDCKNCRASEPVCYLTAGFIAGCLENMADRKYIVDVVEKKCQAVGDPYCLFIASKSIRLD